MCNLEQVQIMCNVLGIKMNSVFTVSGILQSKLRKFGLQRAVLFQIKKWVYRMQEILQSDPTTITFGQGP